MVNIGLGNAFSSVWCQAIALTKAHLLSISTLETKLKWNFNRNSNIFIQENASENIVRHFLPSQWYRNSILNIRSSYLQNKNPYAGLYIETRPCLLHSSPHNHWNENSIISTKKLSLATLKVVIMTTFSAASDENFIKWQNFHFSVCHATYPYIRLRCQL